MPKIWIACLASYNNGVLHGEWVDLEPGLDHVNERIAHVLRTSKYPNTFREDEDGNRYATAEEYAVHDYDDDTGMGLSRFGEYPDLAKLCYLVETHSGMRYNKDGFAAYISDLSAEDVTSGNWSESQFEDRYRGAYDSFRDYADEQADEMIACYVPSNKQDRAGFEMLQRYFDYESFARDLRFDCSTVEHNGKVHVFTA